MGQEKSKNTKIITQVEAIDSLINPPEKIPVHLIGCGGTGSQVLQGIARMNHALEHLGHPGFHLTAYDPDHVSEANIGRQLFSPYDIDRNKASVLIEKINRFYGYDWEFVPNEFRMPHRIYKTELFLTCVDKVDPRHYLLREMSGSKKDSDYWMDFGNDKKTAQVTIGQYGKKYPFQLKGIEHYGIPEFDDPDTPSCSLAEALAKQDLFINSMVANVGLAILWQAFSTLRFNSNTAFINLKKLTVKSTLNYYENNKC